METVFFVLNTLFLASLYSGIEYTYRFFTGPKAFTTTKQFVCSVFILMAYIKIQEIVPLYIRFCAFPGFIWVSEYISSRILMLFFGTFHDVWFYHGDGTYFDGAIHLGMWKEWYACGILIELYKVLSDLLRFNLSLYNSW